MKTRFNSIVCIVCLVLPILSTTGCSEHRTHLDSSTRQAKAEKKEESGVLRELESKAGISLPTEAVLVNSGDGGGRDPSYEFYFWAVFSPSPIKMPVMHAVGVKDYLNLPLEDTVKYVEATMRKGKIAKPESAISSHWIRDRYKFEGTIVRSSEGDYLVVEQFRKSP